jgi:glycosyltransferase involved in cell wall biosynthesis
VRIAVLTGYEFSVLGGAERLILDLARALDADIVAPDFHEEVVATYDPGRSIPLRSLHHPLPPEPWRQLVGMRLFRKAAIDYDFHICIDDMAVRYLARTVPHLYYMLTPRRALYDMYYHYLSAKSTLSRAGYIPALAVARILDRRFVGRHVQNLACISHNVRNRIFKVYSRDARVLYPPVHTDRFEHRSNEGFWLSVGRVDKWKRIELQVEAFRRMPEKTLVVVGRIYPGFSPLVRNAPPNVIFRENAAEEEIYSLYSRCEGFITTAVDEDFGITPVEAMASGKPVVATCEGGYLETIVDGITGKLVSPEPVAICAAVKEVEVDPESYAPACRKRAELFDYTNFVSRSRDLVREFADLNNPG